MDKTTDRILLLVRASSDIKSVKDLKKKNISLFSFLTDELSIPTIWFKTVVSRNNENFKKDYLPYIEKVDKSSKAISNLFFRKIDAAVVPEKEFNISKELNPQIGRQLRIVEASDQILYSIICYTDKLKQHKNVSLDEIVTNFCNMNNSSMGKQFLQMFRIDQFVPFKDDYLVETEKMYKEYYKLFKKNK